MREDRITEIIEMYGGKEGTLLNMLLDIQQEYNYLPKEVLGQVSTAMNIPLSRLYSFATFFKGFSLTPRGRHTIHICMGTACQVWGGQRLLNKVAEELKIKPGETTVDLNFTLEKINCPGCCGLAPVVMIDKDVYGKVTQSKLLKILKTYKK